MMPDQSNIGNLREFHEIVTPASSTSTLSNYKRAERMLKSYDSLKGYNDPTIIGMHSSLLVVNLIADHYKVGEEDALRVDAMNALIQGLRMCYTQAGHRHSWQVDESKKEVRGNPLIQNPDVETLRRAHRVSLVRYGIMQKKVHPLTVHHASAHAEKYWYGACQNVYLVDVMLHAVFVLGLHLGLRFDEVQNIKMENISVVSGKCTVSITETTKNSIKVREHVLRDWPGNSSIRNSVLMELFVALTSWILLRGGETGYLFCEVRVNGGIHVINSSCPWKSKPFKDFLRERLVNFGVGSEDSKRFSGHSLKRGAVQLYRSLGLTDEMIMDIIQMKGTNAYANYCAWYNDCSPEDIPRFSSISEAIVHAEQAFKEKMLVHDDKLLESFLAEITVNEIEENEPIQ